MWYIPPKKAVSYVYEWCFGVFSSSLKRVQNIQRHRFKFTDTKKHSKWAQIQLANPGFRKSGISDYNFETVVEIMHEQALRNIQLRSRNSSFLKSMKTRRPREWRKHNHSSRLLKFLQSLADRREKKGPFWRKHKSAWLKSSRMMLGMLDVL